MKKLTIALVTLLTALLTVSSAAAQPKLEAGKDFIEAPAVGRGLCLHNLFQSDMVLQRDKRIWVPRRPKLSQSWFRGPALQRMA